MNKATFWGFIDRTVRTFPGISDEVAEKRANLLIDTLQNLSLDELYMFDAIWEEYKRKLSNRFIVKIADKIAGGLSDDGLSDFLGWAIVQGQEAVESFINTPESLYTYVKYVKENLYDITCEHAGYVPMLAIDQKTGTTTSCLSFLKNPYPHMRYDLDLDILVEKGTKKNSLPAKLVKVVAKYHTLNSQQEEQLSKEFENALKKAIS
jgi:hypothetical protein